MAGRCRMGSGRFTGAAVCNSLKKRGILFDNWKNLRTFALLKIE